MSYELSFGIGEEYGDYLGWGFGYIEVTEKGEVHIYYPRIYYCPRCGTHAPLNARPARFYAVENVFYPDILEVKCLTCWDHPIVDRIHKRK